MTEPDTDEILQLLEDIMYVSRLSIFLKLGEIDNFVQKYKLAKLTKERK